MAVVVQKRYWRIRTRELATAALVGHCRSVARRLGGRELDLLVILISGQVCIDHRDDALDSVVPGMSPAVQLALV